MYPGKVCQVYKVCKVCTRKVCKVCTHKVCKVYKVCQVHMSGVKHGGLVAARARTRGSGQSKGNRVKVRGKG